MRLMRTDHYIQAKSLYIFICRFHHCLFQHLLPYFSVYEAVASRCRGVRAPADVAQILRRSFSPSLQQHMNLAKKALQDAEENAYLQSTHTARRTIKYGTQL